MAAKKTALYKIHEGLGANMVEFAGYLMPLRYESFREEAMAVRKTAGIFDISHMGRIIVEGPKAEEFLQKVITNDIRKLKPGRILYTLLCRETGGVIDDLIVYRGFRSHAFILVVNASNFQKDSDWLKIQSSKMKVKISDITRKQQMIALQGPNSAMIMQKAGAKIKKLKYFQWKKAKLSNKIKAVVSRTGYTGEDGFEIIFLRKDTAELWKTLSDIGKGFGLKPAGLGARDVLRLEAGLPLYGHELSEEISPLEAELEKFVSFEKGDFIGKEALLKQKNEGIKKRLIGFEVLSGRLVHQDYLIFKNNQEIGQVTSGNASCALNPNKSIGTGFVKTEFAITGELIEIDINGQKHQARIVALPFYKKH